MARIRTIKPEFFTSLAIASLSSEQRLTFIGLWTHVDDDGRCVDDARLIKAALWPLDDRTASDVEHDLRALTESSLITRYTLNRKRYMAVTNWSEHQRINRPTRSKHPAPQDGDPTPPTCDNTPAVRTQEHLTEDSLAERNREQGTGKGREQGNGKASPSSSEIATRPSDPANDRPDVERLCKHLAERIEGNGSKRPTINKRWRDAARLMLDADGRGEQNIHLAIDWCQDSDFWRGNILSMPKLREKYDQLRLAAKRPNGSTPALRAVPIGEATGTQRARQALEAGNELQAMIDRGEISL